MVAQPERASIGKPKAKPQEWVLLSYRIPREPSTPRIAVWRKLRELGVAQLGDGLVALPSNSRTREDLEWVAAQVMEAGGEAMVWVATPTTRRNSADIAEAMRESRTAEYAQLTAEIASAPAHPDPRTVARWRRQWRKIDRRDHHGAPGREQARHAIAEAARASDHVQAER